MRYIFSVLVLLLIAVAPAVGQESPRPIFDPDNYGDVRFSDEKAVLDSFAKRILKQPGSRGVITTFAGYRTFRGEARFRLNRAKNYLVKRHKIPASRIVTIDGGHMDEVKWYVMVIAPGEEIPEPEPATIPKSAVKYTKRRPRN